MFAKQIVCSDFFKTMPLSTQALYFHLSMESDDEGFVNSPKSIQRSVGAADDDLKLLVAKRFVIPFESGVIVIKHWKINNQLRKDRIRETTNTDEKELLIEKHNSSYTLRDNQMSSNGCQLVDKCPPSIVEYSIVEGSIEEYSNTISAEPSNEVSTPVVEIILNDKSLHRVTQEDVDRYTETYPAVDILQELREMALWCMDNPIKRKTKQGIRRFISSWLSRAQDAGGSRPRMPTSRDYLIDSIRGHKE